MEMKRIGGKSLNVYEPCECMILICKNNKNFDMPEEIIESVLKNNLVLFLWCRYKHKVKICFS